MQDREAVYGFLCPREKRDLSWATWVAQGDLLLEPEDDSRLTGDHKDRLLALREYRDGKPSTKIYQSSGSGDRDFLRDLIMETFGQPGGIQPGWAQFALDGYTSGLGGLQRQKGHLWNWRNKVAELSRNNHDLQIWEAVRLRALMRCGRRARHEPCYNGTFCGDVGCDFIHATRRNRRLLTGVERSG